MTKSQKLLLGSLLAGSIGFMVLALAQDQGTHAMIPAQYNATGVVITGGTIDGTTMGATVPTSGSFTTLNASGTFTGAAITGTSFSGPTIGVTDGSNAAAGTVGELILSTVPVGSAITLSSGTTANVTTVSLTAGDWDCVSTTDFGLAGVTGTSYKSGISLTSATLPPQPGGSGLGPDAAMSLPLISTLLSSTITMSIGPVRVNLSAPATVYMVAQSTLALGTVSSYGTLRCRRIR